jgi:hypothetical protein
MKTFATIQKKSLTSVLGAVIALIASTAVHAQILLTVNTTNPNAVVITATGLGPLMANAVTNGYSIGDGIDLLGFFSGQEGQTYFDPSGGYAAPTGNLVAASSPSLAFNDAAADYDSSTGDQTALSIFGDSGNITFGAGAAAFSGTLTLDLTNTSLRTQVGNHGAILAGYSHGGTTTQIGTWEIVGAVQAPEPSTWLLLAGALVLLPVIRRFRRA